jgi:hypothetical protein
MHLTKQRPQDRKAQPTKFRSRQDPKSLGTSDSIESLSQSQAAHSRTSKSRSQPLTTITTHNDLYTLPTDGYPTPHHPPLPPRHHHNTHPPLHRLTTNRQPRQLFTHTPRRHINRSRTTLLHTFECFSLSRVSPSPQQCRESSSYSKEFCCCWNNA